MRARVIAVLMSAPAGLSAQASTAQSQPKPLLSIGAHTTVAVGADIRLIEERYRSEDFGITSQVLDHSLMQRYMVHADVRAGSRDRGRSIRWFTEMKSGLVAGRAAGLRVPDVDTLDVQQAFVELTVSSPTSMSGGVRIGRQELAYGNQRLISHRDFPNVRQSFDAARITLTNSAAPWTVDLFAGAPVSTRVGVFDDATDRSRTLWGVYATHAWPKAMGTSIDVYYVGHQRDRAATHWASGAETRHTLGTRLSARRTLADGVMDAELEPMLQFGHLANDAVRAWSLSAVSGWQWTHMPATPRLSLGMDASSGDDGERVTTRGSYHPLYATGGNMALGTPVGAVNFVSLHPKVDLWPTRTLVLTADWFISWRESTHDGLYNIAGSPIAAPVDRRERFIGHRPGVHVNYALNATTAIGARATYFKPGRYLRAIGWNRATEYATLTVHYRF